MSLINYVEPISVGEVFAGLGVLILMGVFAYIFYRLYIKIAHWFDILVNRELKYEILEEAFLDKIGKAKDINLDKELVKRQIIRDTKRRTFRKRIEDQIYAEMFGEDEDKDEGKEAK